MYAVYTPDIESQYETPIYQYNPTTNRFECGEFSFPYQEVMEDTEWRVLAVNVLFEEATV